MGELIPKGVGLQSLAYRTYLRFTERGGLIHQLCNKHNGSLFAGLLYKTVRSLQLLFLLVKMTCRLAHKRFHHLFPLLRVADTK